MGEIMIPQVERVAISNCRVLVGDVSMPAPLMHHPNRSVMKIYGEEVVIKT